MRGWAAEAAWFTIALLTGLVLGSLFDWFTMGLLLGIAPWLAWRVRDLRRFDAWLNHSLGRPPPMYGVPEDLAYRLWRLRRESRNRMQRLTRALRELQQATEALPDAAVLLEGQDSIAWFNRAGADLLGLEQRDLGRALSGLMRSPELVAVLHHAELEGAIEMPSPLADGRTLDVRVIVLTNARRLLLARDVTQVAKLRTVRQDFIANVSHELRTPLTVILGYLEALEDDTEADVLRSTLQRMQRPATRMKTLVEDLLLLSRLDSTSPTGSDTGSEVNVPALLRRITTEAGALVTDNHRIELEIDLELRLVGVERELQSALSNLIVNAIRYSPDGGVIGIRWCQDGDEARFAVSDQGIGVAEEHVPRLTERFYRVDVGRSRDAGGTGLGLAIVKHVLRRHDSELQVVSRPGQGSTFSCNFPAARVRRKPLPPPK
ncbi:MAG: phosphate regulon sensor histidine kinase PhoR [Gammaproteobacteria bacterium]|nr:MAG: phosphate regulon sensor histidine kinase PhoR [Gammaproteobacteria bacterium]